ncbi:MAG TPA: hypothetical protein V6D22_01245 [Candidatus Obscuribacterales bacterium]
MRLFNFDLFVKKNADAENDITRSRLSGMRAHSETRNFDGASGFMERVRGVHTESVCAQRRTSKDYWFVRQSELLGRLGRSVDSGAFAHLEQPD